ncbi:hypothetical protein PTI98_010684 [Pleurotus ostreatus]|nr:hypothetical protein PTI98_010684 [Pleurotus ostreatus]
MPLTLTPPRSQLARVTVLKEPLPINRTLRKIDLRKYQRLSSPHIPHSSVLQSHVYTLLDHPRLFRLISTFIDFSIISLIITTSIVIASQFRTISINISISISIPFFQFPPHSSRHHE